MKIKTVLFDLDGTLIKTWPFICASFGHVLSHFNLPNDGMSHPKMRHCGLHEGYTHLGISAEQMPIADKLHLAFQSNPNNLKMLQCCSNAEKVLQTLHSSGYNIGVVSNRKSNSKTLLTQCNIHSYVHHIVGHEDVSKGKPDPEGIFLALKFFQTQVSEAVIVGDTIADVAAGKNAGIKTIAVDGSECLEQLKTVNPDHLIKNLDELVSLIS